MGRQYVRQSSASASAAFCSSPLAFAPARTRLQRVVVNTRGSASTFTSQSVIVFPFFYKLKTPLLIPSRGKKQSTSRTFRKNSGTLVSSSFRRLYENKL